ncbi:MAG: hypothetical protein ACRENI_01500 [Gemmatimonadaceae bacterium]
MNEESLGARAAIDAAAVVGVLAFALTQPQAVDVDEPGLSRR